MAESGTQDPGQGGEHPDPSGELGVGLQARSRRDSALAEVARGHGPAQLGVSDSAPSSGARGVRGAGLRLVAAREAGKGQVVVSRPRQAAPCTNS